RSRGWGLVPARVVQADHDHHDQDADPDLDVLQLTSLISGRPDRLVDVPSVPARRRPRPRTGRASAGTSTRLVASGRSPRFRLPATCARTCVGTCAGCSGVLRPSLLAAPAAAGCPRTPWVLGCPATGH